MMDRKIILVKEILNSSFTSDNFTKLVTMLFDDVKLKDKVVFRKEYSNYSSHIDESAHIGDYVDPNGKRIVLFAVKLKKENYVENSRGTQRNYAKSILDNNNYDAAIIAFFMDDDSKWRLSFVRLDYEIKFEGGKSKTNEVLTPARRYSFLVGKDEPSHTAIKQLSTFIEDDNYRPTLNELEEAFSVEKVTKEFYKLYCEKYHLLRDHLDNNEEFLEEAGRHNFDSVQFAKKLMGQIVFLYFLQKKGWLGVNVWPQLLSEKEYWNVYYASSPLKSEIQEALPNVYVAYGENQYRLNYAALKRLPSDVDEAIAKVLPRKKSWGDGPRDFMRKLFQDAQRNNANFFDEYLEPLFYDAMNQNRGDNGYFTTLHCRVPFLSGGLFEPIDGYDWKHTNFNIPNELFSSVDENKDSSVYEADGILDIFDRFNFTMSEDEPLEREVAVDPEMLGKVFENLLEIKDRKSKGAFYTPREIVHYICQQSLVNYLVTKTGIEESAIRDFVLYGDVYKDYDVQLIKEKQYDKLYISELLFKLDARGNKVIDKLLEIDKALENVKIADPAVGSGAFPLGLLNEIVRLRETITTYIAVEMNSFSKLVMYNSERSPYKLKRETIKNCIFAADIEPSAVDIARLRLWLALVIDDNVVPGSNNIWDHANPIPLPNLEGNIVCGNSLVDEFEGFKLIDRSLNEMFTGQQGLGQAEYKYYLNEIIQVQKELYECKIDRDKQEYKDKLIRLRNSLIEAQLRNEGATSDFFKKFKEAEQLASKPYVLWQIDFARVFMENGGFDIVLGNPPYISEEGHKELFQNIASTSFGKKYYTGKMDFWYFFTSKSIELLSLNGVLTFIAPNNWMTTAGGKKMRMHISDACMIKKFINFNNTMVFETASQQTMIFFLERAAMDKAYYLNYKEVGNISLNSDKLSIFLNSSKVGESYVALFDPNKSRDGSVIQFLNSRIASVIENIRGGKRTYFSNDEIINGIHPHHACITKKMLSILPNEKVGNGIFIVNEEELSNMQLSQDEKSLIKPYYDSSNISRYYFNNINNKWIIYTDSSFKDTSRILAYPNIKKHLDRYVKVITSDNRPYGLHRSRKQDFFDNPSIVSLRKCRIPTFSFIESPAYVTAEWYIIKSTRFSMKYLTCLLNSEIVRFWLLEMGKMQGLNYQVDKEPLVNIPIAYPTSEQSFLLERYCDKIYSCRDQNKDADIYEIEELVNEILYSIYEINKGDVMLIKSVLKKWEAYND